MNDIAKEIVLTVLYFDIFNYPLTEAEIMERLKIQDITSVEINNEIEKLVHDKIFYQKNNFFSVREMNGIEDRKIRNIRAEKYIYISKKMAKFLGRFPYVRAIAISGSTSKGNAYKGADVDYIILTEKGRIWLVRAVLILYRLFITRFLKKSEKFSCFNHFITSEYTFSDKNIYVAYEIVASIPVYNENVIENFIERHKWINEYFPNYPNKMLNEVIINKSGKLKRFLEFLLNNFFGNLIELTIRKLTRYRQKRTIKKLSLSSEEIKKMSKVTNDRIMYRARKNDQLKILEIYQKKDL
ncbi:MAG: hypothetical protein JXR51_12250 [Bacteroidales bacterium]|nr:hypothetical protein [Bacteroidales bacterium]MBN2757942.1 hypothetical protein [Bacteroidales bacterium]